jgi:preprotein translocase subunit Sec61beta
MDRDAALDRMRAGLLRFLDHYEGNTSKYSEPITVFYIDRIVEKMEEIGRDVSVVEKCNAVLAADFRR